jgi:hypothetical protein
MKKHTILFLFLLLACGLSAQSRLADLVSKAAEGEQSDSTGTKSEKTSYSKVITKEAVTRKGVVDIHKVKNNYFLEIPFNLMGKPMLLAGRVSEISANNDIIAGQMTSNPWFVEWSADENRVYLHDASNNSICDPSEAIAVGFARNNLKPVMKAFPVKAVNADSTTVVIDVTKFFCGDEKHLSPFRPASPLDGLMGVRSASGTFKADMSSIVDFKAFPNNIIFKTRMVYTVSGSPFTALMTSSLILLPDEPVRPRLGDYRLGIFSDPKILYSENKDRTERIEYINRWDMYPKPEDIDRYKQGELVVPRKQIVYWVDDAFPEKWRPHLKKGIEVWQKAFEEIGFKDAIIAKDYPQDPAFDPEDIRNSCLIYASTQTANAMGPSWTDPRSGEIIQGSVYFYHNVVKLLHNWRFVQTSTVDPRARKEVYDMDVMGQMLEYLVAHEIGHTLGLMHNMRASYAYPVDSLRSPSFTAKYGTTPSIMDYARFNYVAQPGDGVTYLVPPDLGLYDYFAIRWAYQPIFEASTSDEEKPILNQWLLEKSGDPIYQYGEQEFLTSIDPASQSESVGDDAMKAGEYGIKNLKVVMENLVDWTAKEGENYDYTKEMYTEVLRQFNRYIGHAEKYVGGNFLQNPVYGDGRPNYVPVERAKMREALEFVVRHVRELPEWMLDPDLLKYFAPGNNTIHDYLVTSVRSWTSLSLMGKIGATAKNSSDPYTQAEYLDDLYNLIWESSIRGRNLTWGEQKMEYGYVHTLFGYLNLLETEILPSARSLNDDYALLPCGHMEWQHASGHELTASTRESDLKIESKAVYYEQLKRIQTLVSRRAKSSRGDQKRHYEYLAYEINKALDK